MATTEATSFSRTLQEQKAGYQWPVWYATLAQYRDPGAWKSGWQLVNTLLP